MNEPIIQEATASQEERFLAGIAHALIVANFLGAVGAAVSYALYKDKSRFVAFQAAQAAVYQIVGVIISIVFWGCWGVVYTLSLVPLIAEPDRYAEPPAFFWLGLLSVIVPLAIMGLLVVYGLWGAVRAFQGGQFRYLLVGRWIERLFPGAIEAEGTCD